jgi:hypothetical protein
MTSLASLLARSLTTLHTGKVIEVELESLVNLAALAGFALMLFGYLHTMKRDLRAEIAACRSGLKGDNASLRTELNGEIGACRSELRTEIAACRSELKTEINDCRSELKTEINDCRSDLKADIADVKADIGRLDGRLTTIEQRTYDLSTRLPPAPARPAP